MMGLHKYILFSIGALLVALYILFTEIYDRVSATVEQYTELEDKRTNVLTPEEFLLRKRALEIEKKELTILVRKNYSSAQQNQGGLFEHLNSSAKQCNVLVRSIVPAEAKASGSAKEISFTMNLSGRYHDAGKFFNNIETGVIPILILKSEMRSEPIGNSLLDITLIGKARLLSEL
jgi:Tfp pilus assembly protein PilO